MNITILEGADLAAVVRSLNAASKAGRLRSVRISQEGERVKVKINEGMWSPAMGRDGRG